jgi:DNA-binding transcriptional MerR regulator
MGDIKRITHVLSPAKAARRLRVSVKTLRYYETVGLLAPQRTAKGWRVYDRADLARLEEILSFKAMGFGASQIAGLLDATPDALATALAAQELHLERQAAKLKDALDALRERRKDGPTDAVLARAA